MACAIQGIAIQGIVWCTSNQSHQRNSEQGGPAQTQKRKKEKKKSETKKRKSAALDLPRQKEAKPKKEKRSTGPSRVVPHRSTTPARTCLTSLFGWEAVSQADMAALTSWTELAFMKQPTRPTRPTRSLDSSSSSSSRVVVAHR